ncbi:serine/threonine-protein kinase [Thioalkalivibrio sp. ALJ12]|uniref:serine/threonine protein kinase n=3 Tax=Thioalkalivibrio TaxID=106633 RepID=UPI00037A0A3B|nr:serine/threonine-protein kinase [Thioalkalivibrio sp. ALJ12]
MNDHKNALPPGTLLGGRYRIEGLLGAGGFGMVYRVAHRYLDQVHAIKEYLPQELAMREGVTVHPLSTESGVDYEEGRQRFLQEARQLVRFSSHPNIVTCTDFFEANGTAYLVMEYEDGLPLSGLLAGREGQGRPLEESEILGLLRPIVAGLAEVHAQDVLHRDIKPGNIFIRRSDEQPVLLDFGAAKVEFSKHSKSRHALTPGYAAPEQITDIGKLGPWTDIYAIGAVMWRMVTGENPVKSEARGHTLFRGGEDPVALEGRAGASRFSQGFLQLVSDCLAYHERERPQTAEQLLRRIESLCAPPKRPAASARTEALQAGQKGPPRSRKTSGGTGANAAVRREPQAPGAQAPRFAASREASLQNLADLLRLIAAQKQANAKAARGKDTPPTTAFTDKEAIRSGNFVGRGDHPLIIPPGTQTVRETHQSGEGHPCRDGSESGDLDSDRKVKANPVRFLKRLAAGEFGLARTLWMGTVLPIIGLHIFSEWFHSSDISAYTVAAIVGGFIQLSFPLFWSLSALGVFRAARSFTGPWKWRFGARLIAFLAFCYALLLVFLFLILGYANSV